jgi:hypothetical protein
MLYTDYQHHHLIREILPLAQIELKEFLENHEPTEFADLRWFEKQYGYELPLQDVMKLWYAVPNIRASKLTEWSNVLPRLSAAAKQLPGVVNFTLNAIAPGGQVPIHSDYTYDMRKDLSKSDLVYVILLGVDIPSTNIDECGFKIGDDTILIKTNDIIAFDGGIPHCGWNFTDKWRYTINIDLSAEYWNV